MCRMIPLLFAQLCILGRERSQIRIKSWVGTVKHVEALQFSQISSIVVLNVKILAFTPYSVCVLVVGIKTL